VPLPQLQTLPLPLPHVVVGVVRSGDAPHLQTLLSLPQLQTLLPLSLPLPHVVVGVVRSGDSPPTLLRPPPRRRALPQLQTLLPLQLQLPQLQTLPPPLPQVGSCSLSAAKTGTSGAVIWPPCGLRLAPRGCGLNRRA
jgi:hypothetical protein